MNGQRRHESPDVGDAIVRMLRGLVARAAEGDTEAVEQLARVEQAARVATPLGGRLAHDHAGYSYTELGRVLGVSRQAARQRAMDTFTTPLDVLTSYGRDAHQLLPGHRKSECKTCRA